MVNKGEARKLNTICEVSFEPNPKFGEDAYTYYTGKGFNMIGVFDGCGGLGGQTYSRYDGVTGAWIASRALCFRTYYWTSGYTPSPDSDPKRELTRRFKAQLDELLESAKADVSVIGSMVRAFPSTARIAILDYANASGPSCRFLWAGDSRGYLLMPDGLKQITVDDIETVNAGGKAVPLDPFENLYEDAPLKNLISAGKDISLNERVVPVILPAIVLVATDGMFSYLPTPMNFETLLLNTMANSHSVSEWCEKIRDRIKDIASDDATLVLSPVGFTDFAAVKKAYAKRREAIAHYDEFAEKHRGDMNALRDEWNKYKTTYLI